MKLLRSNRWWENVVIGVVLAKAFVVEVWYMFIGKEHNESD